MAEHLQLVVDNPTTLISVAITPDIQVEVSDTLPANIEVVEGESPLKIIIG